MINYKNTSFVMAGFACLVFLLNMFFWSQGEGYHSLVPGFSFTAALAFPVMSAWLGIIIRRWKSTSRLWILIPLGLFALAELVLSVTRPDLFSQENRIRQSVAMIIMGYLIPESQQEAFTRKGQWLPSLLVLIGAALCYTCVMVAEPRVSINSFTGGRLSPEEAATTQNLVFSLLKIAETASLAIAVYFAAAVSFSSLGRAIGEISWVRPILGTCCVLVFFWTAGTFLSSISYRFRGDFLIRTMSNPVFVYLVIVISRTIRKLTKRGPSTWKEVFAI